MLGHRNYHTTQRYAHIADTVLRDAVNKTGKTIARATKAKPRGLNGCVAASTAVVGPGTACSLCSVPILTIHLMMRWSAPFRNSGGSIFSA
jgi:formamidopyrimidine-DNA glycosylase